MTDQMTDPTTATPTAANATDTRSADAAERADLAAALRMHRALFLKTMEGVSDRDAARRTTVSELCLGGLVKHVAHVERLWAAFVEEGAAAMGDPGPETFAAHAASFRMEEGETLAGLIERYEEVSAATAAVLHRVASLDLSHPLPERPWFEPGAVWSARQAFLHILAETAQHAGHADILREAIDGAKTMG
ncbi:DinB family protein [Acidiferrimicrobium sp. IK]|uniref:DinB family protein n=1 Tax=Acidiferrimicrobium sp. IK TaxID=2871700 RepID=UPI0021CB5947|nr:DinB family protein [Acidiferrimicrobium sp. IK]MCU4183396.1 DinB family protein [Acidiferrimicrobium sp. IK]